MASAGPNLAITRDGEPYNKLQRPDDYLTSTTPLRPPLPAASRPESHLAKRKRDKDHAPTNKRVQAQHGFAQVAREAPVRECGTRSRLPGVDDEGSLSDSSTSEALAYLRSVRSEALTIPPVLIAPTRQIDRSDDDDEQLNSDILNAQRSIYEDGVWVAVDDDDEAAYDDHGWDEDDYGLDPQESCYVLLLRQYRSLRHKLRNYNRRILNATTNPSEEKPKVARALRTKQDWLDTINQDYPIIEEVCQMNDRTLFYGLHCYAFSLSQSCKISHQASCWAWTLLALIGDVGTLDNERMSRVRNLGFQAGRLGVRLREYTAHSQQHSDGSADEQNLNSGIEEVSGNGVEGVAWDIGGTKSGDAADMSPVEKTKGMKKAVTLSVGEIEKTRKVGMLPVEDIEQMGKLDVPLAKATEEMETADHDQLDLAHGKRDEQVLDGDLSESDTDMSISDSGQQELVETETKDLEQARGRLLAQLGDRLVQPVPPSRADAERQREQMRSGVPQQADFQPATPVPAKQFSYDADLKGAAAESDWNTRAAIDMILTVVAESYGQRDLLKFREAW